MKDEYDWFLDFILKHCHGCVLKVVQFDKTHNEKYVWWIFGLHVEMLRLMCLIKDRTV